MATIKKHRTTHLAEPDENGAVLAICETCKWRALVDVRGLSWIEGMAKIYEARDAHELDTEAQRLAMEIDREVKARRG